MRATSTSNPSVYFRSRSAHSCPRTRQILRKSLLLVPRILPLLYVGWGLKIKRCSQVWDNDLKNRKSPFNLLLSGNRQHSGGMRREMRYLERWRQAAGKADFRRWGQADRKAWNTVFTLCSCSTWEVTHSASGHPEPAEARNREPRRRRGRQRHMQSPN